MHMTTVLVVDDISAIRAFLRSLLEEEGFRVVTTNTGSDGLQVARRICPDVVILDLCLPGMDGWEVLAHLRADPALETIPVIAMTGYSIAAAAAVPQSEGFVDILAKPLDITMLLSTLVTATIRYASSNDKQYNLSKNFLERRHDRKFQ